MYHWLCKKEFGSDTPKCIFTRGGWIPPPLPRGSHEKNMPWEIGLSNICYVITWMGDHLSIASCGGSIHEPCIGLQYFCLRPACLRLIINLVQFSRSFSCWLLLHTLDDVNTLPRVASGVCRRLSIPVTGCLSACPSS